ncbi:MAG: phosphopyruvate hydratase [Rhodomicrobium sp.]
MRTTISAVRARRIWDSRGRPTVEAEATLAGGATGRGMAPAGASRGRYEATDLRDGGSAFGGFDVQRAIANVNSVIAGALIGHDAADQEHIDGLILELDPSPPKDRLGGNACIAVSMAVLQAAANAAGVPLWKHLAQGAEVRLPLPEIQVFGGGAHAGRRIDIQDLLIMPVGAHCFSRALEMAAEVYLSAGRLMEERGKRSGVADEGGWWPNFDTNEEAIETLLKSIERAGLRPGENVAISLDLAASEFYRDGRYVLGLEGRSLTGEEWADLLDEWLQKYPIISVEDPVAESDVQGMADFTARAGAALQIVGDDFFVTNARRIREGAAQKCCNAVLLKPNQAGTITETRRALEAAKAAGYGCIVSARSGETEDTTVMHLAVGWNADQLKVGSFARSERMAKWNEGIRIEDDPQARLGYAGGSALPLGR